MMALSFPEVIERLRTAESNQLIDLMSLIWLSVNEDLAGTDLSALDLTRARLSGANLSNVDFSKTKLRLADMRTCNLSGADLIECDLRQSSLGAANLDFARLENAKMRGADLTGATLTYANLAGADLTRTKLQAANFTGANLDGAWIRSISYDEHTVFADVSFKDAILAGVDVDAPAFAAAKLENARVIYEGPPQGVRLLEQLGERGRRKMNGKVALRSLLERLIQAENRGGQAASDEADGILDVGFLGITRGSGVEQDREQYLNQLAGADRPEADNRLRWLDIADPQTAPDLVEPGSQGPRANSSIDLIGETAAIRAVVTTRTRSAPDTIEGRFRNLFVLVRRGEDWKVFAWQVTPLKRT